MNALLMVSDGLQTRVGTLTAGTEWFKSWRTIDGEEEPDLQLTELQVMLEGVCAPDRFLILLRDFMAFEDDGSGKLVKKMAGYHQFHAVRVAVQETLRAAELQGEVSQFAGGPVRKSGGALGDRRTGVIWHTQGSGKSLTMGCYAGAIVREPDMANPYHRGADRPQRPG